MSKPYREIFSSLDGRLEDIIGAFRAFYVCVETGSLTKAADALQVSVSNISRSIYKLEESFGTLLLRKGTQGVELTHNGQALYEEFPRIYRGFDALIKKFEKNETFSEKPMVLKIASNMAIGPLLLPRVIAKFRKIYPHVHTHLHVTPDMPEIGKDDVDVVIWPYEASSEGVFCEETHDLESGIYASPSYLQEKGEPKSIAELQHHDLVGYNLSSHRTTVKSNWLMRMSEAYGVPFQSHIVVDHSYCAIKLVEEGVGITAYAHDMVKSLNLKVKRILPEVDHPSSQIYFVCSEYLKDKAVVKSLLEVTKHHLIS